MTPFLLLALLVSPEVERLTKLVSESGRVPEIAVPPSQRIDSTPRIAPGSAPLVSFRLFEGRIRHRFSNLDLVVDDAGH